MARRRGGIQWCRPSSSVIFTVAWQTLKALVRKLPFKPKRDRLWLVGDLVNRGSDSLGVLRWAHGMNADMGERFVTVLGNHDLHLLALDAGADRGKNPDLVPILEAPDRRRLVDWLRSRPLLHCETVAGRQTVLVHAGLWPSWTTEEAVSWSCRVAERLRDPKHGHDLLLGPKALRRAPKELRLLGDALYGFTSLRTLKLGKHKEPCRHKGPPSETPEGCVPWFEAADRRWQGTNVVFGHWAALGLFRNKEVTGLDSGCAWGGSLTALRLEDGRLYQVARLGPRHPLTAYGVSIE